jgi:adenosylcobyric acid synthase
MVLGTSSGAGKSLMTAALCRVLRRRGEQPLPFKGQNMSNNAWVDQAGGEMAYSQALQAWAAGLEPQCAMNPVLLKPQGDSTSEVIHLGRSVGQVRAEHYYRDWFRPGWQAIRQGLESLQQQHPAGRLVLEGAGSPVEVNLMARDLTNLRLAQYLRARCILVADIERGGVFAQIVGSLALMSKAQRSLIGGLLINRFRGRRELFDSGCSWLEQQTGLPVLGVMPWLDDLFPPEDSLDLLERGRSSSQAGELEIGVLRLPSLSNFSDLDPLEAEPSVRLRWIRPGDPLGRPDALILPGSKRTLRDLATLRRHGLDQELIRYALSGGQLLGICGGLQMLGVSLEDPDGLEGGADDDTDGNAAAPADATAVSAGGLALLPLQTRFERQKTLRQRQVQALWPPGESGGSTVLEGFELHHGVTTVLATSAGPCQPLAEAAELGWWRQLEGGGVVAGTYLHGVFDSGAWRRRWLNQLRQRRNLEPLPEAVAPHSLQRDQLLDRLADAFEAHVTLAPLLKPPQSQAP